MANGEVTLEDVLEEVGLIAKWEKRGEARGVAIGEARGVAKGEASGKKTGWEEAIGLLKQGYTLDQLERMGPGGTPNPAP
jgi:hypothetical protein